MRLRTLFAPVRAVGELVLLAWLSLAARFRRSRRETLVWGPVPIINNRYWSAALAAAGRRSVTLMREFYPAINRRDDFDLYFEDLVPRWVLGRTARRVVAPYFATRWVMQHASVVHIPFSGGPLGDTRAWRREARLLHRSGVKIIVIPYGSDVYRYSRVDDPSLRHGLMLSYPRAARHEAAIEARVQYWTAQADIVMAGFILDGCGRWDVTPHNMCAIDTGGWRPRPPEPSADGTTGTVVIAHAPNHRGLKGTEFVLRAVEQLQDEGLAVDLLLLENVPNTEVKRRFQEAHVFVDQLIIFGHGFAAIEGMASALPVIVNLDDDRLSALFRRYSFLDECPLVSGTPETIADVLRELVRRPDLREELGRAGRQYVERYHSYESSARVFNAIYATLLEGATRDLMRAFDPAAGIFPATEPIRHPLVNNRLAADK